MARTALLLLFRATVALTEDGEPVRDVLSLPSLMINLPRMGLGKIASAAVKESDVGGLRQFLAFLLAWNPMGYTEPYVSSANFPFRLPEFC